jgi:hypothetical protein
MENKVYSLLGGFFLLMVGGIVLQAWYWLDPSGAGAVLTVGNTLPFFLLISGALGMNVAWVLYGLLRRLERLERDRQAGVSGAPPAQARD